MKTFSPEKINLTKASVSSWLLLVLLVGFSTTTLAATSASQFPDSEILIFQSEQDSDDEAEDEDDEPDCD